MKYNNKIIKIIQQLAKEFNNLVLGKMINITFNPPPITTSVRVYWYEDITATYCEDFDLHSIIDRNSYKSYQKEFEKIIPKHMEQYNKKINRFVKKCDKIAAELNMDKDDFWNEIAELQLKMENKNAGV